MKLNLLSFRFQLADTDDFRLATDVVISGETEIRVGGNILNDRVNCCTFFASRTDSLFRFIVPDGTIGRGGER